MGAARLAAAGSRRSLAGALSTQRSTRSSASPPPSDYRDQIGESGASNPDRLVITHHSGFGVALSLKSDVSQFKPPLEWTGMDQAQNA